MRWLTLVLGCAMALGAPALADEPRASPALDARREPATAASSELTEPASGSEGRGSPPVDEAQEERSEGNAANEPPAGDESDEGSDASAMPSFGAAVRVARLGTEAVDPSASATTVALRERPRALETLDEILREVPGARARTTGSYGGFSSLSLRGADAEHTTVLLGELPLVAADGTAVDLSMFPPWLFERIEVYRGGAPLWLGAGAIGGVLRLVPRAARGSRMEISLGAGSFDRYEGRGAVFVGDRRLDLASGVALVSSSGAFPYIDDGGTAFDASDDRERLRQNAHLLEGSGLLHARARALGGRVALLATGLGRAGGLAPPPSRFVDRPRGRRASRRLTVALSMDWLEAGREPEDSEEAAYRVSVAAGVGVEDRTLSDPLAQFGQVPREASDVLARFHLRVAGFVRVLDAWSMTALAHYAHESVDSADPLTGRGPMRSARDFVASGLEQRLRLEAGALRAEGRLAVRVEGVFARLDGLDSELASPSRERALVTFRASAMVEPVREVALVASISSGGRAPSTLELFGDRGYLAGNPALAPEESIGGDVGVLVRGAGDGVRGRLELRGFYTHARELIRYQRTSQNQAVPRNVAAAHLLGGELGVAGEAWGDAVRFTGALTLLDAREERTGLPLPLRPPLVAYARLEARGRRLGPLAGLGGFVDIEHVASVTADPAALVVVDERTRVGLGLSAELLAGALRLDVTLRDLLDARGFDVLGLPLPGRTLSAALTAGGW